MKFQHICNRNIRFGKLAFWVQIIFLIVFGINVQYGPNTTAKTNTVILASQAIVENPESNQYHYLKDVMVMMVVGFGFLMTFMKRHGYSSVGYNLFLCALVIQWAIIMNGVRGIKNSVIFVDMTAIINALFTLCGVLISFGAVIGKVSLIQLFVMALIEVPILSWNEELGRHILHVVDAGDSIFVHGFGAYFGLGVALVMYKKGTHTNSKAGATYNSDLFAMIGTLFLWIYWPSFNAGVSTGREQSRALVNTILSLTGATLATAITSTCVPELEEGDEEPPRSGPHKFRFGRFNMVYLQNSTIAGGVAIGSSCGMEVEPCLAILIGFVGGSFSVLGYRFFTKYVNRIMHDTCGVHNLHGFPSFIAAIASACASAFATPGRYGDELFHVFPAMSPTAGRTFRLANLEYTTELALGRTGVEQGGYQMASWAHTFLISFAGGIFAGLVMRFFMRSNTPDEEVWFDDIGYWTVGKREFSEEDGVLSSPELSRVSVHQTSATRYERRDSKEMSDDSNQKR